MNLYVKIVRIRDDNMEKYYRVYDFTNENVACLEQIYNFKDAKVLSIVGSGDQYFASILNGARQVDLFDLNPTSYLYFLLKFYSIRELNYNEFYDFFVKKDFTNKNVYEKLIKVLPKNVLEYYKYLVKNKDNPKKIFKGDGINLLSRRNQKYYFKTDKPVIPYLDVFVYYKLQVLLKKQTIPKFFNKDLFELEEIIKENYDILLLSNVFNYVKMDLFEYSKFLNRLNIPQIQVLYDWYGLHLDEFNCLKFVSDCRETQLKYSLDVVRPSAPNQFDDKKNFVYSLKNRN